MGQPASTNMGGTSMNTGPTDTCLTPQPPPVGSAPMPYPNSGQNALFSSSGLSKKVKITGAKGVLVGAKTSLSSGDEMGALGGVVSGKFIGAVECTQGSSKVRIEGKAPVRMGDPTKHNQGNTVGAIIAPSQAVVLIG